MQLPLPGQPHVNQGVCYVITLTLGSHFKGFDLGGKRGSPRAAFAAAQTQQGATLGASAGVSLPVEFHVELWVWHVSAEVPALPELDAVITNFCLFQVCGGDKRK